MQNSDTVEATTAPVDPELEDNIRLLESITPTESPQDTIVLIVVPSPVHTTEKDKLTLTRYFLAGPPSFDTTIMVCWSVTNAKQLIPRLKKVNHAFLIDENGCQGEELIHRQSFEEAFPQESVFTMNGHMRHRGKTCIPVPDFAYEFMVETLQEEGIWPDRPTVESWRDPNEGIVSIFDIRTT